MSKQNYFEKLLSRQKDQIKNVTEERVTKVQEEVENMLDEVGQKFLK